MSRNVEINIMDLIPPKYERNNKNDSIIKYLTIAILFIDCFIFFGTIQHFLYNFNSEIYIINFVYIILFFILNIAWLHYKLQHVIMGGYKIFMNFNVFRTNSKYYSGIEIPDSFLQHKSYPNITIQIPLYKEDLENTIQPTIFSAIEQAKRYTLETGSICNIIVCDDGLNLISTLENPFNCFNGSPALLGNDKYICTTSEPSYLPTFFTCTFTKAIISFESSAFFGFTEIERY